MTRCNPYRLVGGAAFMGVIFSLSACGGSSSSGSVSGPPATTPPPTTTPPPVTPPPTTPVTPPDLRSFNELKLLGQQLAAEIETATITPEANMPISGRATYQGIASFRASPSIPPGLNSDEYFALLTSNPGIVSNVYLMTNFETAEIDGMLTYFQDIELGLLPGSVNIGNGKIEGNAFTGDLAGSVGPFGGEQAATGGIDGAFLGDTPEFATGNVYLDVGSGSSAQSFDGVFTAN
jgi:hypothetical protein